MQLNLFDETKNEGNTITVKNIKELAQVLNKLQGKELIVFKNREIFKDKFFEVRYKNNYEEIFRKPAEVIEFLTDEKTWLERKYSPKKISRKKAKN